MGGPSSVVIEMLTGEYLSSGGTVEVLPTLFKRGKSKKQRKKILREAIKEMKQKDPNLSFYLTKEWKELRYKALKKYGNVCQCCGARPQDGVRIHVDHIKPRSRFPLLALDINNLQVLCEDCNVGKSNLDSTDWR